MTFFSSRSGNRGIYRSGGNLKKDPNIFHQIKVHFFCLNIRIYKCLVLNWANESNFHPLEVVGRNGETQFHVGENVNSI